MKDRVIERLKLMHEELERNFSNTTTEAITQIIERTRKEQGHSEAEAKAKELRLLIETGISEAELLNKLNQMK
jgi:hypothetical protein